MIVLTSETIPDPLPERAIGAVRTAQLLRPRIRDASTAAVPSEVLPSRNSTAHRGLSARI